MARRRDAAPAAQAGTLAVPAYLLPITAQERRVAAIIADRRLEERGEQPGPSVTSDEVAEQAASLAEWLEDHGIAPKDYQGRNAAIQAGQKLKSEERKASHNAPSQRMRKR